MSNSDIESLKFPSEIKRFITKFTYMFFDESLQNTTGGFNVISDFFKWRFPIVISNTRSLDVNFNTTLDYKGYKLNVSDFVHYISQYPFSFIDSEDAILKCGIYPKLKYNGFWALEILQQLELGSSDFKPIPICRTTFSKLKQELNNNILGGGVKIDY